MPATMPAKNHRHVGWREVIEGREVYYEVTVDGVVVFKTPYRQEGFEKYKSVGVEEGQFGTYEDGSARLPIYD